MEFRDEVSKVMPPFRRMEKEKVPYVITTLIKHCNYLARQYRRTSLMERFDQGSKGIPVEHALSIFLVGRELENCLYALDREHYRGFMEKGKSYPEPSYTAYPDWVWQSDEDTQGAGHINEEWWG